MDLICDLAKLMLTVDPAELGWLGTARQIRLAGMTDRLAAAIAQRAAELGLTTGDIKPGDTSLMIETSTAQTWLAADKLAAYIDGLQDALANTYGNAPVEVGSKDLKRVLDALGHMLASPDTEAAAARLRQVLDEPPQRP